jgi:hypothetical protein
MKRLAIAALFAAAAFPVFAQNQPQAQQIQVGRYQLMQATFSASPDNASKTFTAPVLLDTATGIISRCDYTYTPVVMPNTQPAWEYNGFCTPLHTDAPGYLPRSVKK